MWRRKAKFKQGRFSVARIFRITTLTARMPGRKTRFMFPRRDCVNTPRALARGLLTLFIGAFLLACQPRVGDFAASHISDRESKLLSTGAFFDGVIASRAPKCADIQSEIRLLTGRVWD